MNKLKIYDNRKLEVSFKMYITQQNRTENKKPKINLLRQHKKMIFLWSKQI